MRKLYLVVFTLTVLGLNAQQVTPEDYKRAVSFMYDNYNNKTAFNLYAEVKWFKDSTGLWFIDHSKDNKTYKTVSFKDNTVEVLFDQEKLAKALSDITEEEVKPKCHFTIRY